MSDQIRISDSGELETVPTTWDGEPLYSPSTVAEGLFDADAFKQMKGQTSMAVDESDAVRAFNAYWEYVRTPEAAAKRAAERADYEARYEAMMARKRAELER